MAKQEFDKDYVFNLIMPSAAESKKPPEESSPGDAAPPSGGAGADGKAEEFDFRDSIAELKSKLFLRQNEGVVLRQPRNLVLVNLMENLVVERLDQAFEKFNCCKCDKCKKDVAAIALNSLPPQYVVTDPDFVEEMLKGRSTKEISTAIIKAILKVKSNPRH